MTSTTDNDLPDGWEASSITVADEQVAYCISSSTQPDRQVYLTASGALGITAAGDGCWAPARAVAHVLSRADVDSTKAALVLPRGMSAAEAQALLDVAAEAVGYVGEPGTPERQRWADDVMVMGACRETDANKALRSAAREYAKAWDDYKNESRKSAAARNESANADTIAAAAIAYARAVDAADEKSRTAEEYEAANAEARRRLVAAVQREVPATRTEKLLAACGAMGTPEPMESGIPKAGGAPESGYIVELGGWALTPAEQAWLDGVAAKHGLLIGERHGPWNPSQAEVKRAVEHLAGDEPSHRRCTSGCGWAWTGTSTEPCPKCGAERASDEPGGESP